MPITYVFSYSRSYPDVRKFDANPVKTKQKRNAMSTPGSVLASLASLGRLKY